MTSTEQVEETEEQAPAQTTLKRCFSGSGKFANRKWAPGGDASYLSKLRKAYLADETVADPWFVQDHGGIEAQLPEGMEAWPQMSAIDVARRLDTERGAGVESHWAKTLETAKDKFDAKTEAQKARAATTAATKAEKAAAREAQGKRPKKGSEVTRNDGEREGQTATVLRHISPTQLLIRYEDGMEELVIDQENQDVTPVEGETSAEGDSVEGTAEATDEGEFTEQ